MTLLAAHKMDTVGNKAATKEIAIIKVIAPKVAEMVVDQAIQGIQYSNSILCNNYFFVTFNVIIKNVI